MESIQPGFFERGMKIGLLGGDEDWEDDLPRGTANYYRPFQKVVVFLPIGFSQISWISLIVSENRCIQGYWPTHGGL